jgi:glycosyltransferase involved in cell wall biosynthesis
MEALALERPVIGSRIRGTTELLEPGCGVLVEVGHVDGYASAMVRLLDDPEAARAMGVLGRQYMRNFDITNIIRLHEELYAKVLGATWELSPSAAVPVETSGVA